MKNRTEIETRRRIERELASVNRLVEARKKEPVAEELEALGDNTPLSEEGDAILAVEDRELRSERLSKLLERAAALDEALHRLDAGAYGLCIACNQPIPHQRLRALPEALRCTPCQEEVERGTHPREVHAHEWKLTEETYRERARADEGESAAAPRAIGTDVVP
jgi:RNA polymerase-binding transcription factor DksA